MRHVSLIQGWNDTGIFHYVILVSFHYFKAILISFCNEYRQGDEQRYKQAPHRAFPSGCLIMVGFMGIGWGNSRKAEMGDLLLRWERQSSLSLFCCISCDVVSRLQISVVHCLGLEFFSLQNFLLRRFAIPGSRDIVIFCIRWGMGYKYIHPCAQYYIFACGIPARLSRFWPGRRVKKEGIRSHVNRLKSVENKISIPFCVDSPSDRDVSMVKIVNHAHTGLSGFRAGEAPICIIGLRCVDTERCVNEAQKFGTPAIQLEGCVTVNGVDDLILCSMSISGM
jgi:hypothetical protein